VPNVRGQSPAAAEANLRSAGFSDIRFVDSDVPDPGVGPGEVIGTEPAANSQQAPDTQVTVLLNPQTD
jgi:eukaryotic-like serine/threonine-protein kinase